ncbi:MAG: homoserine O-acetyltransferase, partial [Desulfovibrionaceae bacterium]
LVISYTSDWLYPTYQSRAMVQAMKKNGLDVSFVELEASFGHDAFLLPNERTTKLLRGFLERVHAQELDQERGQEGGHAL